MASGSGRARRRGARRGKVKKRTKYLSLSRHLSKAVDAPESKDKDLECSPPSSLASPSSVDDGGDGGGHEQQQPPQQQLEAFALHPGAPSTLFAAAPSLTDILGASSSSAGGAGGGEGLSSCGASPDDASGGTGEEEDLARRALRGRERWVYCRSSSSSPPSAATTTTTTTSSSCSSAASTGGSARSRLLKLDYDEILAAWADRGSLYIGGAAAAGRAAPELELDSVFVEVGPSTRHVAAAWSAPETVAGRAERVRRYLEKRQGRLFQKRIRYEVRRINAVRRPRLKGRFIKQKEGAAMADGTELQPS